MTGKGIDLATIRDIVHLLIQKVAASNAALGQILAVKLYENLTYCHSVNVATLSLLIGKQIGFDQAATAALAEAALLHDIGKTRIPLEILKKPSALDKRERRMMEAHTTYGAEILVDVDGLRPLTPTVALEHHRGVDGMGYPDLEAAVPHLLSQVVAVADIYEAMTGARSYQEPAMPEQACLVLARLAGTKLNTALVKAFVNAISFFPLGSVVRTDRDEVGVVVRTTAGEPLHPVIALIGADQRRLADEIDTSRRLLSGQVRAPRGRDAPSDRRARPQSVPRGVIARTGSSRRDFGTRNPMRAGWTGGRSRRRMISNTFVNCASYRCSSSSSRAARSACSASIRRSRTKARMIATLTIAARRLRSTLESMATPCSVNT